MVVSNGGRFEEKEKENQEGRGGGDRVREVVVAVLKSMRRKAAKCYF